MQMLKKVLERIKPDEAILIEVDAFVKKLNAEIKKKKIKAKAVVGGSIAKGTFLKNDCDVDLFVKFDLKYKNLSEKLEKILKPFKPERVHGSRDYFQLHNKITYEIVPVLDIKKEQDAKNVTDFSPLHVDWVKKHLRYADDIRLAKQFCKVAGVYGAESYIKGFSGHVLDIITIHYKGFMNLVKAASKWKKQEIIDHNNVHDGHVLMKINKSKLGPLVVVDPLQQGRNAAAALGVEKYTSFIKACRDFVKKPDESFFSVKEFSLDDIMKQYHKHKIITLTAKPLKSKKDVMGAKLLKCFLHIHKALVESDFSVITSGWTWKDDDALFYFVVDKHDLELIFVRDGPPVIKQPNATDFKEKHPDHFVKTKKLYARVKRKHVKAEELVKNAIKSSYVLEKIKEIRIIPISLI